MDKNDKLELIISAVDFKSLFGKEIGPNIEIIVKKVILKKFWVKTHDRTDINHIILPIKNRDDLLTAPSPNNYLPPQIIAEISTLKNRIKKKYIISIETKYQLDPEKMNINLCLLSPK